MAIVLVGDQSAEPNKCGSCCYFARRYVGNYAEGGLAVVVGNVRVDCFGICELKLPPWVLEFLFPTSKVMEVDPRTIKDTDTCSFWEPRAENGAPAVFVQKRYWQAGQPRS